MSIKFALKNITTVILLLPAFALLGQTSLLRGKVIDKVSGETLIGASIVIQQNGEQITGTTTDFDGNYSMDVEAGTYDIVVSYVSYSKQTITGLEIKAGEANLLDVALEGESQTLNEVVVTATVVKNTDAALIALQRKAFSIQDGVSSQQISRTGSSNAADAMRQMTGAVVEGGRFIVMRGLGDRYSLSQLNGITLPSTDPYRNSTSLDLIPAQIIENIVTVKTFTPDLPGNFSGGLVNINTKSFPDKFNLYLSLGAEYNTQSSFNENFKGHASQGDTDWLGLDDGSRDQPDLLLDPKVREQISNYIDARRPDPAYSSLRDIFNGAARGLSNEFVPVERTSPMNSSINLSVGDRFKVFGKDLGYTLGVNYSSNYNYYDGGITAIYFNNTSPQLAEYQNITNDSKSTQNPQLGVLFNLAYKFSSNHAISGNIILNNDAEIVGRTQAGSSIGRVSDPSASFNTNSQEFVQRQFTTYQVGGTHIFSGLNNVEVEWVANTTKSFQKEPDLRYFAYTAVGDGDAREYYINQSEVRYPYHFFRELNDDMSQAKIDISIPFLTKGNPGSSNKIKLGGLYSTAERDFEEYFYEILNTSLPANRNFTAFKGDFNAAFDYSNFGIIDTLRNAAGDITRYQNGYFYLDRTTSSSFYNGKQDIFAAYLMSILNITPNLKAIAGVRMETTNLTVESGNPNSPKGDIDLTDFLYSANLIYSLSEKANIRVAASRTLARPNMRELAPFLQFDLKDGTFNVGNPNLKRTLIQNYDIRFELYPRAGELLAISAFYKLFDEPIIRAFNPRASVPELSFVNVDEAKVYGVELEFRKGLDFISPTFEHFYFSTNLAIIESTYDIPADEVQNSKTIDPTYDQTTRPFQGQAPFITNFILSYINPDKGWESSLAFNVTGERLYSIALFATPDIYEQPFPLLNFKLTKRFADHYQIGFTAKNILNSISKKTQEFKGREYIAESYKLGTGLGLSLSYFIK
ncbi:MAG: TonB-dependent receptor [Saprospiraceae bacterium]|nr:TonB-dependent receptor [Saprospiraceae bacterium]